MSFGSAPSHFGLPAGNNGQSLPQGIKKSIHSNDDGVVTTDESACDEHTDESASNESSGSKVVNVPFLTPGHTTRVFDTIISLMGKGSKRTQRIVSVILFQAMPQTTLTDILRNSKYAAERRKKVIERKKARNEAMRRAAERKHIPSEDIELIDETCKLDFKNPIAKSTHRKAALATYKILESGLDPPEETKATKISETQADALAYWVAKTFQYRPGKSRNSKFLGVSMKDLPFYVRYGSLGELFKAYKKDVGKHAVGQHPFYAAIRATTRTGTVNSGLSYYWVDFVELTKLLVKAVQRLKTIQKKLVKAGVTIPREAKEEAEK
jgi:hypothetical protein